jgi:hypothetical protein
MDARSILEKYADKAGWNKDSMLDILCEYIDNQFDNQTLKEFLACKQENEEIMRSPSLDELEAAHRVIKAYDCNHCKKPGGH